MLWCLTDNSIYIIHNREICLFWEVDNNGYMSELTVIHVDNKHMIRVPIKYCTTTVRDRNIHRHQYTCSETSDKHGICLLILVTVYLRYAGSIIIRYNYLIFIINFKYSQV